MDALIAWLAIAGITALALALIVIAFTAAGIALAGAYRFARALLRSGQHARRTS